MLQLKVFQAEGAKLISDRYAFFANHPYRPRKGSQPRAYFQALSALTGAGKTPILAQAVSLLRGHFTAEPIVFWISKAKSVVAQTYTNFSPGGKYSEIIDGFRVITAGQLNPHLISDSTTPLMVLATTGLFNNRDQSDGSLNIYKKDNDLFGDESPWQRLISRSDNGVRRPLLIVYDEGHNLSPQQTELLAELEPDAYLMASATLKLPENFSKSVIRYIKQWVEDDVDDLQALVRLGAVNEDGSSDAQKFITTAISSEKVVTAELVKKAIQFDGTTAPMEKCLDDLLQRMKTLQDEIRLRGLSVKPKAIYVCKTNVGNDGDKDDHTKPFDQRDAPPIKIWRYLVEERRVDPKDIAIYANLSFSEGNRPDELRLFSKGENDFDEFQAADFQHIIFNKSLQEGWDDPACYLAYIDKSMGSSIQVEQIIGRVLRQYGATHYENPLLNSAHFFLRVDNQNVFTQAIAGVKAKLLAEGAPIEIVENYGSGNSSGEYLLPKEEQKVELHHIYVDSDAAREKIAELIDEFPTFSAGSVDTIGQAHSATQIIELGKLDAPTVAEWKIEGHTNPVRLRWLVDTAVKARSTRALAVIDVNDPKFDVRVQVQSNANKSAEKLARDIVEAFYAQSDLVYESLKPFQFTTLRVGSNSMPFENGLYERYAGFNKFEGLFARALDGVGNVWHRNNSSGGFHIPLLSEGDTASFYPDFIVWKGNMIYCLDTKGGHLLSDAVARKLFDIKEDQKTKLMVRFITEGRQTELRGKVVKSGYTVWKIKSGSPTPIHFDNIEKAIKECLR